LPAQAFALIVPFVPEQISNVWGTLPPFVTLKTTLPAGACRFESLKTNSDGLPIVTVIVVATAFCAEAPVLPGAAGTRKSAQTRPAARQAAPAPSERARRGRCMRPSCAVGTGHPVLPPTAYKSQ